MALQSKLRHVAIRSLVQVSCAWLSGCAIWADSELAGRVLSWLVRCLSCLCLLLLVLPRGAIIIIHNETRHCVTKRTWSYEILVATLLCFNIRCVRRRRCNGARRYRRQHRRVGLALFTAPRSPMRLKVMLVALVAFTLAMPRPPCDAKERRGRRERRRRLVSGTVKLVGIRRPWTWRA